MLDSLPCHFLDVSLVLFTSICSAAVTFLVYYRYAQPHTHGSRTSTSVQPDGRNGTEAERGACRGLHVTVGSLFKPSQFSHVSLLGSLEMYGLGLGLERNVFHQFFNSFCNFFFLVCTYCCIYLVALGLRWYSGFSLVVKSGGCCLLAVHSLLIVVASLVSEHGL